MSVNVSSQNLSGVSNGRTVVISIAEMDSITLKLLRLGTLEQLVPLLQTQVADIKLIKAKQDTLIFSLKEKVSNLETIIRNQELMITEYEAISEANEANCKAQKKQIRKRLLLIGGGGTISGIIFGLVFGILAK